MPETPLLNLQQELPKPEKSTDSPVVPGILFGVLIAVGMMLARSSFWDAVPSFSYLWCLPAIYLTVLIHELGHAIVGRLLGIDFTSIAVGGFVLSRSASKHSFRFEPGSLSHFGGYLTARASERLTARRFAGITLGGPFASVALTLVCAFLIFRNPEPASLFVSTLWWMSLLALSSLIPNWNGPNMSDAALLWEFARNSETSRTLMTMIAVASEDADGVLPRDWNAARIKDLASVQWPAFYAARAQSLAYSHYADRGETEVWLLHLEKALNAAARAPVRQFRYAIFLNAAAASARPLNNAAQARTWFERARAVGRGFKEGHAHVQATIAMAENRHSDALPLWAEARERMLAKDNGSGSVRAILKQIGEAEQDCRKEIDQLPRAVTGPAGTHNTDV